MGITKTIKPRYKLNTTESIVKGGHAHSSHYCKQGQVGQQVDEIRAHVSQISFGSNHGAAAVDPVSMRGRFRDGQVKSSAASTPSLFF